MAGAGKPEEQVLRPGTQSTGTQDADQEEVEGRVGCRIGRKMWAPECADPGDAGDPNLPYRLDGPPVEPEACYGVWLPVEGERGRMLRFVEGRCCWSETMPRGTGVPGSAVGCGSIAGR